MPLSNSFLSERELDLPVPRHPLEVGFCPECALVQVIGTVPRSEIFRDDYAYYSSYSRMMVSHAHDLVADIVAKNALDADSFVVEIASNDGYLLQFLRDRGVPHLGVDPSGGPVDVAIALGIPTIKEFFNENLAARIRRDYRRASIVLGLNVLAHVDPIDPFVRGVHDLLDSGGTGVFEVPYVMDLVDLREFDTICHEHLCYFSVHAAQVLFERNGLFLNRVERTSIHGGSLRLYVGHTSHPDETVGTAISQEVARGLIHLEFYENLTSAAEDVRSALTSLVRKIRDGGKTIAGYGAAGKGTVLLNYCGLDNSQIDFIADLNPSKQGRWVPGVRIPIVAPERIDEESPDYIMILAWNLRDEILSQLDSFRQKGGKFIIPLPSPEIV